LRENLWQKEERCRGQRVSFDAESVFRIGWFLLRSIRAVPPKGQIDAHVVVDIKNFSFRSFRIEKSYGTYPAHRRYVNMSLSNFHTLIFRGPFAIFQHPSLLRAGKIR